MKFLQDKDGFFTLDVLVLSIIVCSIASVWAILSYLNQAQIVTSQRTNAIFLAQGHLNEIENKIIMGKSLDLSNHEKIVLNDVSYDLNSNITVQTNNIYLVKVRVTWQSNGAYQYEQQERELVKI